MALSILLCLSTGRNLVLLVHSFALLVHTTCSSVLLVHRAQSCSGCPQFCSTSSHHLFSCSTCPQDAILFYLSTVLLYLFTLLVLLFYLSTGRKFVLVFHNFALLVHRTQFCSSCPQFCSTSSHYLFFCSTCPQDAILFYLTTGTYDPLNFLLLDHRRVNSTSSRASRAAAAAAAQASPQPSSVLAQNTGGPVLLSLHL